VYAQSPLSQIAGSASLVGALFGKQGKEGTGQSVAGDAYDWLKGAWDRYTNSSPYEVDTYGGSQRSFNDHKALADSWNNYRNTGWDTGDYESVFNPDAIDVDYTDYSTIG
jgi:hypothetical protein